MKRLKIVVALFMAVVILGCIPTAMACYPYCEEYVNPHGTNIPPAGSTTLPGPNGGINDDGFYRLGAEFSNDYVTAKIYVIDKGADNKIKLHWPYQDFLDDNKDNTVFGPYEVGTVIKYTEANGAEPSAKKIGSDNGQAGAVSFHIKGQGDMALMAIFADSEGCEKLYYCSFPCLVPPPPK